MSYDTVDFFERNGRTFLSGEWPEENEDPPVQFIIKGAPLPPGIPQRYTTREKISEAAQKWGRLQLLKLWNGRNT